MRNIFAAAVIMFLSLVAAKADAASIIVEQIGTSNVYIVKGYDFKDVGGVEIVIQYDTATLSNPRLTQGSKLASTMFMANPKFTASTVKIAAMSLSAINGSGDLATITFDLKGSTAGPVLITNSKLAPAPTSASSGVPIKHETATVIPSSGGTPLPSNNPQPSDPLPQPTVAGTPSIGTITLPQDQLAATERKTEYQPLVTDLRKDMTLPLGGSEAAQTSAGTQQEVKEKGQEKKFVSSKSTLQLFSEVTGERSPRSLIALFAESSIQGFTQDPPIAFSDGKTPLRLSLALKSIGSQAPKFILQGANVKQLSGEGEDLIIWTVDAIPKKDATEAKLTVIDGQSIFEIPLTIVPKIDPLLTKGKALSEADFALYLKKPQKFDLNKDGKFDAVDDFIYTANYIVAMKIKPEKMKKEEPLKPDVKGADKPKEPAKVKDEKGKAGQKPAVTP